MAHAPGPTRSRPPPPPPTAGSSLPPRASRCWSAYGPPSCSPSPRSSRPPTPGARGRPGSSLRASPRGLAALAMAPGGVALALVNGRGGPEVLESTGGLSSWQASGHEQGTCSQSAELALRPWPADRRWLRPGLAISQRPGLPGDRHELPPSWGRRDIRGAQRCLAARGADAPDGVRTGPGPRPVPDRGRRWRR